MKERNTTECARCGSCTVVCPVFRVTGRETLAARGKMHLLSTDLAASPSRHFQDIFSQCLLCGACEEACSRQLPIREHVVRARSSFPYFYGHHSLQKTLVRLALSRPSLLEGLVKGGLSLARLSLLPENSGLRIKLGLLEKDSGSMPVAGGSGNAEKGPPAGFGYFSGCMARYLQPSIAAATIGLAEALTGSSFFEPDGQVCCGLAAWSAGRIDEAKRLARRNMEAFSAIPGQILTSCASCSAHLKQYPALFEDDPEWHVKAVEFSSRVVEFTSFVAANIPETISGGGPRIRVYYHEPCHLRFDKENRGAARRILERIDSIELVESDAVSTCCGQGGLFHLGYPELSEAIFSQVYALAVQAAADVVITSCSGCLLQWQAGLAIHHSPVRSFHFAPWLATHVQIKK